MADAAWKRTERELARDVGTERIPVTGERAGADFVAGGYAYQVKRRRTIPQEWRAALAGIEGTAVKTKRRGVLVVRDHGTRRDRSFVVVSWETWRRLVDQVDLADDLAAWEDWNKGACGA